MSVINICSIYPFADRLKEEERREIEASCYTEKYQKGSLMHRSDGNCKGLMTVISGQLRTYIVSDEGREVTLFRVDAGNVCVLSVSCLMDSISFDVLIEASRDTEVLILPAVCLNRIIKSNPYAELYLYKTAAEKFSNVMWTMQQILFMKTDQRLAAYLLEKCSSEGSLTLQTTHDEIARNIGSAREVVTRVLKYLAEDKAIELSRGRITITDKEKLKNYL